MSLDLCLSALPGTEGEPGTHKALGSLPSSYLGPNSGPQHSAGSLVSRDFEERKSGGGSWGERSRDYPSPSPAPTSTRAPVAPPTASSALSSPPRSFLPSEKATYRIFSYALVFLHPSTAERCRSPSPRPHDLGEGWAAAPCPTFYSQIPQPDCACSQPLSLTLYLQTSRQTGLAQQLGRISREIHRDKKLVPADARLRAPFIEQNEMVTF